MAENEKHPSGVECIEITEHMGFCLGNAIKYIWRADLKNDKLEDLKKSQFYLNREITKIEKVQTDLEKARAAKKSKKKKGKR